MNQRTSIEDPDTRSHKHTPLTFNKDTKIHIGKNIASITANAEKFRY